MSFHKDLTTGDIHVTHAFVFADAAARLAAVSADFSDPDDLLKVARQTGDQTFWILEQITPSVTWKQLGGSIASLSFTTITDPAVNAAVTQSIIDVFDGVIITLTGAGNVQTMADPSNTSVTKCFAVMNHIDSPNPLVVEAHILNPGHYTLLCWDGTAWAASADAVRPIGTAFVVGNSTVTTITVINTWVDAIVNAAEGSIINQFALTNATLGELTYTGLRGFTGLVTCTIAAISMGGTQEFHFRMVKNGSVLPDIIEAAIDIGTSLGAITLIVPISCVNGDTLQLQVENADGTSDITLVDVVVHIE